jgi:hypothetical protein
MHLPVFGQYVPAFKVIGRVVDENGNGLPGVGISISPQQYTTLWTSPYIGGATNEDGRFVIEGVGNDQELWRSGWFLYTDIFAPHKGFSLIASPHLLGLQRIDANFNGIPFFPKERPVIDVGDVPVKFRHGNLYVTLPESEKDRFDWGNIVVAVKHRSGVEVVSSTLSKENQKKLVSADRSGLMMSLPEGRWKIEFHDLEQTKVLFASDYVDVTRATQQTACLVKQN